MIGLGLLVLVGCTRQNIHEVNIMESISITSSAFARQGNIPEKYTCKGDNVNPPIHVENIPINAKSVVLIMDDPDAPGETWDHWIMWDIPATTKDIQENSVPRGAIQGTNSWGNTKYQGPCPPSGTHRYVFKVYALDTTVELRTNSKKNAVEQAMRGHIIARGELIGMFSKKEE